MADDEFLKKIQEGFVPGEQIVVSAHSGKDKSMLAGYNKEGKPIYLDVSDMKSLTPDQIESANPELKKKPKHPKADKLIEYIKKYPQYSLEIIMLIDLWNKQQLLAFVVLYVQTSLPSEVMDFCKNFNKEG